MRRHSAALLAAAVAGALALTGCGSGGSAHACCDASGRTQSASLVLDFTPNAVHVGIYTALARHFDTAAGIRLHVEVPGASTDAISELEAGRVDFAILDIHDLAIARTHGAQIRGVLPIVERPLAAVIAAPSVHSPRELVGRTVGVTGDPSDLAVLRSEVAGSGGDPSRLHTIDIGYDAVPDLLAGRVAGATSFWDDEGVAINRHRAADARFHVFRVDDYGAPSYPELVVCTTSAILRSRPSLVRDLVDALTHGYDYAIAHPVAGAHALESQVSGLDPGLVSAELPGLIAAFTGPEHRFGALDVPLLRRWAAWEARFGIVRRPPDVAAMFDSAFAPATR